jgi:hypothetical protein
MKGTIAYIAIIVGIVFFTGLALMPFGAWVFFAAGLACGAGAAIANHALTTGLMNHAAETGKKSYAVLAPAFRMPVYILVFFVMTFNFGLWAGVGAAAGCLAGPVAILLQGFIVPKLMEKRKSAGEPADGEARHV